MEEEVIVQESIPSVADNTKWYVLRVVSGKERSVKEYLDKDIARSGWVEIIKQVFLPMEKVYKVQNGKKVMREKIFGFSTWMNCQLFHLRKSYSKFLKCEKIYLNLCCNKQFTS